MKRTIHTILCMVIVIVVGCAQTIPHIKNKTGNITYGMAKKHIKVGKTTQEDIVKLFGSPDNMIMKRDKEIWIYDRFRVESSSKSSSGYGSLILFGGSSYSSNTSTHTKSITIIIDFNNKNVVEELNMRVGGY